MDRERLIEQIRNAPEDHPLSLIEWIPVEERLPEPGHNVIIRAVSAIVPLYAASLSVDGKWFGRFEAGGVTHWAEIPEALMRGTVVVGAGRVKEAR
jgi:hypothetical protein